MHGVRDRADEREDRTSAEAIACAGEKSKPDERDSDRHDGDASGPRLADREGHERHDDDQQVGEER